ncbi:MAG: hypothetical protein ABIR32_00040 [Ilumatobacteraceae bacterium]
MSIRTTAAVVLIATLLATGCSDAKAPPTVSSVATADRTILALSELPCSGGAVAPPPDFTVLFDAVALPTSDSYPNALQTSLTGTDGQTRLFAKTGLWYKPNQDLEIVVPADLLDQLSIGWASPAHPASRVTTSDCTASNSDRWVVVAGGYWIEKPMCATLVVRVAQQERRVTIGLGQACQGQDPPLGRSDQ